MSGLPSPYRSPELREQAVLEAASRAKADVQVLGRSVEGRAIHALRVSRGNSGRALLVCAGIHGPEYIGVEVALGMLARLDDHRDLLERADLWIVPTLNPDGYARTWEREGVGKLHELRRNAGGVDLNRNFPLPGPLRPVLSTLDGWRTGSDDPANPFYRGRAPFSEPETAALESLLRRVRFDASVSLHSTMGTIFPPCLDGAPPSVTATYAELARAFTGAQTKARYRYVSAGSLDRFTGEQEDHQHHTHHTWSICVEHYPLWVDPGRFLQSNLFRRFNPPDPEPWVASDVPAIAAYFREALKHARPDVGRSP
ncbi:MAG: DUF2817 domain-containing protein [Actinobacteria bacterium]|nr:DUF2817 domain-containing protein [Actinomycetota bacterium]